MKKKKNNSKYLFPLLFLVMVLLAILIIVIFWQINQKTTSAPSFENLVQEKEKIMDKNKIESDLLTSPESIIAPSVNNELESIGEELKNPYVLVEFINENFDLDFSDYSLVAQAPEIFYQKKEGNSVDVAVFSANSLKTLSSLAGIIRYDYLNEEGEEESRFLTYFRYNNNPKYLTLNQDNQVEMYTYGRSFRDLIKNEEDRLNVKVFRYALFSVGSLDLSEVREPFSWQYLD